MTNFMRVDRACLLDGILESESRCCGLSRLIRGLMPILCLVDLSIVGRGTIDINAIVLLLRCPLRPPQDVVGSWAEYRNEVRSSSANLKGVEFCIEMQLLCLFHGSDCLILVTRAK